MAALADEPDRHVVLDNTDPEHVGRTLAELPLAETAINVVSQSGTTAETLATLLVVREQYHTTGVDWTDRTVVTTAPVGLQAGNGVVRRVSRPVSTPRAR